MLVPEYSAASAVLDERGRRLWTAAESRAIGYGGDSVVSSATGLARQTIRRGRLEIETGVEVTGRVRCPGGGRHYLQDCQPALESALERLVAPAPQGNPMSPLRWTCRSRTKFVGDFRTNSREWQPKGAQKRDLVHGFPQDAIGKALPYGIYDMAPDEAWVSVGQSHDMPQFAVASIRQWWRSMGKCAYPGARTLFITADAGGTNGHRSRVWKHELQKFADNVNLRIRVNHFAPGTSKWNKIEHRPFCHITQDWRGKPLRTCEAIVGTIDNMCTKGGLRVKARLYKRTHKKKRKALVLRGKRTTPFRSVEITPEANGTMS